MKIFDRYRIALHNIFNNKSRSILTTIIVYLMSFVIMGLLFISVSFSSNLNKINDQYIRQSLDYVTTDYSYFISNVDNALSKKYYVDVSKCLNKNEKLIDAVKYESNYEKIIYTDYRFNFENIIEMKEGSYPDVTKINSKYAVVSMDYINKYKEDNSIDLKVGDNFTYSFEYYDSRTESTKNISLDLIVSGIFASKENIYSTSSNSRDSIVSNDVDIIVDMGYVFDSVEELKITEATFYTSTKTKGFSTKKLSKQGNKFVKEMNGILPKISTNGKAESTVYNITLEEIKIYTTINSIFIGLTAFISLILILLSIGSLSNTIMISVNKNRKFIGLLKAMGIKQKSLESIIRLESITTITVGILLSFITLICFRNVFININEKILYGTVSYLLNEINYTITFSTPFYIPLIVLAFFLALTFLFSRTSIRKIANEDPISVISEVA